MTYQWFPLAYSGEESVSVCCEEDCGDVVGKAIVMPC